MKIRQRMLIVILGSILVILFCMLTYIGNRNNQMALTSATSLASTSGEKIAVTVQKEMAMAMDTARILAGSLEGLKSSNVANRDAVNAVLKNALEDNPSFLAAWTVWEPNAFDGLDTKFANTNGTDGTGRLIPYWSRNGSTVSLSALTDYDKSGAGDYYLLAKNSGNETILNPYVYKIGNKDMLMTSLVVPIHQDNKVIGVAGIDVTLEQLQAMMKDFKLYNTGYTSILSNDSSIVTSPQTEQIGKKFSDVFNDESSSIVTKSIHDGALYKSEVNGFYKEYTPITIGHAKTPWSVGITIPMNEITAQSHQLLLSTILAGILALLLLAAVVMWLTKAIVKPINRAIVMGEMMAKGDFSKDVPKEFLQRRDEIGQLSRVLENISISMRSMIGQVSDNASQVAAASQQIAASAEELASVSNTQATDAQTVSELFKELSAAINSVAHSAEQASELSNNTTDIAKQGGQVLRSSIDGMNVLHQEMSRLEEDSTKIGEIIEVIDNIAEQTNLLALNAAIEAARAGEQGRGFAVVADEVRKLAERSGEATKQITEIIKGMQQNTQHSVKAAGEGVIASQKTGESFEHIVSMVNESARKVMEIAAASEQQAAQSTEVLSSIENISTATEEAAASSQETASTAQSLAELAEDLNKAVSNFKIN